LARRQAFRVGARCAAVRASLPLLVVLLAGCAGAPVVARTCDAPALGVIKDPDFDTEDVTFATPDGVLLQGTLRSLDVQHGVVLVHGLNEDRHSYDALASSLAARGFTVLTFDLRGHGASTTRGNDTQYELRNFTAEDFARMDMDAAAAVEILRGRGVGPCITVVGASVGANLALRVQVAKPNVVTAVALLSPGHDYRNLTIDDAARAYQPASIFLGAGRGDAYAAQTVADLRPVFGARATVQVLETSAHGTNLLREPGFAQALQDWLVAAG
jgi:pimeloyl-ACP methyl ester carboxylesterase